MEIKPSTPLMEPDGVSDRDSDRASTRTDHDHQDDPQPPDGGFWAWLVLVGCFLVNGIIFGIINTFGILFVQLKKDMEAAGERLQQGGAPQTAQSHCQPLMTSLHFSKLAQCP